MFAKVIEFVKELEKVFSMWHNKLNNIEKKLDALLEIKASEPLPADLDTKPSSNDQVWRPPPQPVLVPQVPIVPDTPTVTPPQDNPRAWMDIVDTYRGMHEDKEPERVMELVRIAGLEAAIPNPKAPWCGAFAKGVLDKAGCDTTGATAQARSFANVGKHLETPVVGCLVVCNSHVGFADKINDDGSVDIVGGNQSDTVNTLAVKYFGEPIAYRMPQMKQGVGNVS